MPQKIAFKSKSRLVRRKLSSERKHTSGRSTSCFKGLFLLFLLFQQNAIHPSNVVAKIWYESILIDVSPQIEDFFPPQIEDGRNSGRELGDEHPTTEHQVLEGTQSWGIFHQNLHSSNLFSNSLKHAARIDQIEDELIHEKLKIKAVSDDVDGTFKQMETGEVGR